MKRKKKSKTQKKTKLKKEIAGFDERKKAGEMRFYKDALIRAIIDAYIFTTSMLGTVWLLMAIYKATQGLV